MNNKSTIQQIEDKYESAVEPIKAKTTRKEINFKDIEIKDDRLFFRDTPFSEKAQNKILAELQVKKGFVKYAQKLNDSDWDMVSTKLKNAQGERIVYGRVEKDSSDKEVIQAIYGKNTKKKSEEPEDFSFYVEAITGALAQSDINYDLGSFNFNRYNRTFDLSLLNRDASIDIFKNGKDMWDGGHSFTFNSTNFSTSPFFERLVCTNGMRSRQNMFNSSINQSRFNIKKIGELIQKSILEGTEGINEAVVLQANHLAKNNVSIAEFENFRKMFITNDEENKFIFEKIKNQFFNDKPFYQAYQTNIAEKSAKWKSTADSGINAYQFFNMLTWIASHTQETGIDDTFSRRLQLSSSNLFFKNSLDLEDVATKAVVNYPTEHIAFN